MSDRAVLTGDVDTCVVVPCFNEATRLSPDAFSDYLGRQSAVGFLLVDDGSADATGDVLQALCERNPGQVAMLSLPENQGKAEAVRQGMIRALEFENVSSIGFWDADLSTPLDEIQDFRAVLDARPDIDIVIGVRLPMQGRRIERSALRAGLGRLFAAAASVPFGRKFRDTQCGAKLFRITPGLSAAVAEPFLSAWIFDVELLARCRAVDGPPGDRYAGIYEQPLEEWVPHGSSKVGPWSYGRALLDVPRVWYRIARHRRG